MRYPSRDIIAAGLFIGQDSIFRQVCPASFAPQLQNLPQMSKVVLRMREEDP